MQLAQILSDLVSLRADVCDPAAALALVSARSSPSPSSASQPSLPGNKQGALQEQDTDTDTDADLRRARELVHLHYAVRERCRTGELGRGLAEARRAVEEAMG
ncbi:hypothetical protein SVAN01_07093 [Stagonosporopsis vannaccii]|nr:hypothetical protein SVAN01_07093 [Stagonosporopsis vannaccii]